MRGRTVCAKRRDDSDLYREKLNRRKQRFRGARNRDNKCRQESESYIDGFPKKTTSASINFKKKKKVCEEKKRGKKKKMEG